MVVGSFCIEKYFGANGELVKCCRDVIKRRKKKEKLLERLQNNEMITFLVGEKAYKSTYNEHIYSIPLSGKKSVATYELIRDLFMKLNICFFLDKKGFPYIKVYYRNDIHKYLEVNNNKLEVRFSIVNNKYLNAHL